MESNSQNNSESWGRHYLQKVKSAFVGENKLNAVPMPEELENLVKPTPEFHINRYMEQYPQFAPRFYFIEPTSWRRDERLRGHWETEILDPGALMPMVMPKQKEPSLSVNGRYFRDKSFVPTKDPYDFTAYIARGTQMWICGAAFGVLRHLIAAFVARKRPRDSLVGWEIPRGGEGPRHLSPLAIRYNAQGTIGVRLDGADPVRKTVMSMNKRVRKMAWKKKAFYSENMDMGQHISCNVVWLGDVQVYFIIFCSICSFEKSCYKNQPFFGFYLYLYVLFDLVCCISCGRAS